MGIQRPTLRDRVPVTAISTGGTHGNITTGASLQSVSDRRDYAFG